MRDLITMLLQLFLCLLSILSNERFDFFLIGSDVLICISAPRLKFGNVLRHRVLFQFGHQGLTHAKGDRTLVQRLVCLDCHFDLITNTN